MIETLALEVFSWMLPPTWTFKGKFLLAFLTSNTIIIMVMFLTFKIFGLLK